MNKFQQENSGSRKAENEALYAQYVGFSKSASKLFLLLVSLALYIGFTLFENEGAIEKNKEALIDSLPAMIDSVIGPKHPEYPLTVEALKESEFYNSRVKQKLDEVEYELPFVSKDIKGTTFFIVSPIIFFIITLFYWFNLRSSEQSILRFFARTGGRKKALLYPGLYNIKFESAISRIIWQFIMELSPVLFLLYLMLMFFLDSILFQTQTIITLFISFIPIVIHFALFRVKIRDQEIIAWKLIGFATLFFVIFVIYLFFGMREPVFIGLNIPMIAWNLTKVFLIVSTIILGVILFDLLFWGKETLWWIVGFPVSFQLLFKVEYFVKERQHLNISIWKQFWKQFVEIIEEPSFGYIGYFRDKYHEQKLLQ